MAFLPIALGIEGKLCVVVGGGAVAERKVKTLDSFEARVKVIAPKLTSVLTSMVKDSRIEHAGRDFLEGDLTGAFLVFAASDDVEVNRTVATEAKSAGILVNVVDRPELCDFYMPAIAKRGDLVMAVSTSGRFPMLAASIRDELERIYAPEFEGYLMTLGALRERMDRERIPAEQRKAILKRALEINPEGETCVAGKVYLIGAGPGDPGLITVKGLGKLSEADVVIYDRLVPRELLAHAKTGAEVIYVGKTPGTHSLPQEEINEILIAKGLEGKTVARMKGGDPCVFGRCGEEAIALARAGIAFEIIPGVTSATAAPASAGITITKRGVASCVTILSGHQGEVDRAEMDWSAIANTGGTIVIMMGIRTIEMTTAKLMEGGLSPETPVVVVEKGTLPGERVIEGTLGDISVKVREEGVESPAVVVVGEVVARAIRPDGARNDDTDGVRSDNEVS